MQLPLFPLHTVLFPGETLPLHVFEPRYRALVGDLIAGDGLLGIVAIKAGSEVGETGEIYTTGTLAGLEHVVEFEDGRFGIAIRGRERLRILARLADDPYPRADIDLLADDPGGDAEEARVLARTALSKYLAAVRHLGADLPVPAPADPVTDSFALSAALPFDVGHKQRLLECETGAQRLLLFAETATREALLLDTIGPSAGVPATRPSPN